MRCPHRVDVQLLHKLQVTAEVRFGHTPAVFHVCVMMVHAFKLDRDTVNEEFVVL